MNIRVVWPAAVTLAFALLALDGCALLDPAPDAPSVRVTNARLVLDPLLTRRKAAAGIFSVHRDIDIASDGCRHRIYLDGNAVADLRSNEVVHIYAAPGPHMLRVEPNGTACSGSAYEIAALSERGTSQSFKTGFSAGSLLLSAAD